MCSLTALATGLRETLSTFPKGNQPVRVKPNYASCLRSGMGSSHTDTDEQRLGRRRRVSVCPTASPTPYSSTRPWNTGGNGAGSLIHCWSASSPQFRSSPVKDGTLVGQPRWTVGCPLSTLRNTPLSIDVFPVQRWVLASQHAEPAHKQHSPNLNAIAPIQSQPYRGTPAPDPLVTPSGSVPGHPLEPAGWIHHSLNGPPRFPERLRAILHGTA